MAEEVEHGWMHRRIEKTRDTLEEVRRDVTSLQVHQKFAVTHDHVKDSEERSMRHTDKAIGHVCDHLDQANGQQSEAILSKMREMLGGLQMQMATDQLAQHQAQLESQKHMRGEIVRIVIGGVVSVIGSLILFWMIGQV